MLCLYPIHNRIGCEVSDEMTNNLTYIDTYILLSARVIFMDI